MTALPSIVVDDDQAGRLTTRSAYSAYSALPRWEVSVYGGGPRDCRDEAREWRERCTAVEERVGRRMEASEGAAEERNQSGTSEYQVREQ